MDSSEAPNLSLSTHFHRIFSERRDLPALQTTEKLVRYGNLLDGIGKTIGWLEQLGIVPGDRIAVSMTASLESVIFYLANLFYGTILVPLNPRYMEEEIRYRLDDSGCTLYVRNEIREATARNERWSVLLRSADHRTKSKAFRIVQQAGNLSAIVQGFSSVSKGPPPEPDQIALLCYTSGTTGKPKGAMITQKNLAAMAWSLHHAWGWSENDVLLHALPLFHVHGLLVALQGALFAGALTILLPRFDAERVLCRLGQGDCTLFMGVPTMYGRLLSLPPEKDPDLAHMRLFVSGSASLSVAIHKGFASRFGHTILERYGMTEAGMVLSNPLNGDRKPGAVGFPLPGVSIRIVDPETLQDVEPGSTGELLIRSEAVCRGYWNQPEADRKAILPGRWFRSGDLALMDGEHYIHIVGRCKELIITGGFNVYPREVEEVLERHTAVRESAVLGLEDVDLGEQVHAAVVLEQDARVTEEEILGFCRSFLTPYKCPRSVSFLKELPRNAMGKIVKETLKRTFREQRMWDA